MDDREVAYKYLWKLNKKLMDSIQYGHEIVEKFKEVGRIALSEEIKENIQQIEKRVKQIDHYRHKIVRIYMRIIDDIEREKIEDIKKERAESKKIKKKDKNEKPKRTSRYRQLMDRKE